MPPEPTHPYTVLDVFTDTPLSGNPLAVFTEGESVPSRLMQATARELHLSETVFLLPGDGEADAAVRIFTPGAELPFAGHPLLGAAFLVGERDNLDAVRLRTGAGIVAVALTREDAEIVYGEMEQPLPTVSAYEHTEALLAALGLASEPALPVEHYINGPGHVIVVLDELGDLTRLNPDMAALAALERAGVSCAARDGAQIRVRNFAPAIGVPEDPATGSAAGPLAVHLVRHGWAAFAATIEIVQGIEIQRPSRLYARVEGTRERIAKVAVGGSAVTVAHGHIRLA